MQSVVSVRGQTVIPKEIREKLGIGAQTRLRWAVKDGIAQVFPIPEDPVRALIGVLEGKGSTQEILDERRADREREEGAIRS